MRRIYLSATAAIDEFQAGDRASTVIGVKNNAAKSSIPDNSRCEIVQPLSRFIELKRSLSLIKLQRCLCIANPRQELSILA